VSSGGHSLNDGSVPVVLVSVAIPGRSVASALTFFTSSAFAQSPEPEPTDSTAAHDAREDVALHHSSHRRPGALTWNAPPGTVTKIATTRVNLPRVHIAGSDAHCDANIEVGPEYPMLEMDGTRRSNSMTSCAASRRRSRPVHEARDLGRRRFEAITFRTERGPHFDARRGSGPCVIRRRILQLLSVSRIIGGRVARRDVASRGR
jgi:hypothetical protein